MLATYMRRMRNNKLEIRIAGSSCRPQLSDWFLFWSVSLSSHFLKDTFFEVVELSRHFRNEKRTGAKMLPAYCFWDRYRGRACQLLANFSFLSQVTVPEVFAKVDPVHSSIWRPFVNLETRRELDPKCLPQLFLGSLPGTRRSWSAIGQYFPRPSHNSRSFFSLLLSPQKPQSHWHTQAMVNQQFKTIDYHWIVMGTMLPLRRILTHISRQHRQIVQLPLYQHI